MKIETIMCDYVRLTTFNQSLNASFWESFRAMGSDTDAIKEGRFRNYAGLWLGELFCGEGEQRGVPHFLLQSSGETSQDVFGFPVLKKARCTRIDLQVTVPSPKDYSSRTITDGLRSLEWPGKGKARKINLVDSADGLHTVYVGSRESERFIRIYLKVDDFGKKYARFEVEFKEDLAPEVWLQCWLGKSKDVLSAEFERLPYVDCDLWRSLEQVINSGAVGVDAGKTVSTEDKTFKWIARIAPAIQRMANSHQYGNRVRDILRGILLASGGL